MVPSARHMSMRTQMSPARAPSLPVTARVKAEKVSAPPGRLDTLRATESHMCPCVPDPRARGGEQRGTTASRARTHRPASRRLSPHPHPRSSELRTLTLSPGPAIAACSGQRRTSTASMRLVWVQRSTRAPDRSAHPPSWLTFVADAQTARENGRRPHSCTAICLTRSLKFQNKDATPTRQPLSSCLLFGWTYLTQPASPHYRTLSRRHRFASELLDLARRYLTKLHCLESSP